MTGTKDLGLSRTVSEDELAGTLELSHATIANLSETIARDPNSTIDPPQLSSDAPGREAVARLDHGGVVVANLAMGETIGQGGMGLVRAAIQRSLGRKVAVKTLRPEMKSDAATLRLLREGWVTGLLEHPNIGPVYDLGLDDDGSPIIVLKHIEGSPWSALIADAPAMKQRFGGDDLLEHNLRILVQVCNAVSLAHARGILHRDLKPENVMIGRFGEVYLVDWGIAVSLRPDPTGRLPLASAATEMAGTPSYMAPEMLGALGGVDERTDVYLLGAILHEILVGQPPHGGARFQQIVGSILLSTFALDGVAPELATIARHAMSRLPADRPASAAELRQRVEGYLRRRGSLALSSEASRRVDELAVVLRSDGDADALRDKVHRLFAEARFGFRQAMRTSEDDVVALTGLQRATELVVTYELEAGTAEAAAAALADLPNPPPELAQRVADAMRARDAEKKRVVELERLEAAHDPSIGRRTRMFAAGMLSIVWAVTPQGTAALVRRHPSLPHWSLYAVTCAVAAVMALVVLWGRESLLKTLVNRRLLGLIGVVLAAQLTLEVGGHLLALPDAILSPLHLFAWFVGVAIFAVLLDTRFFATALAFLACFLYAAGHASSTHHAMSVANLCLLVNLVVAWFRPREDHGYIRRRFRENHALRKERRRVSARGSRPGR